jgi:hypothetical protein
MWKFAYVCVFIQLLFYIVMAPKHVSSDAGNLDI